MVNRKKKGKYIGMAGALVVHVAIIALLILVGFTPVSYTHLTLPTKA